MRLTVALVFALPFCGLLARAQSPQSICGVVQDQSGATIAGATVELGAANIRDHAMDHATTDAGGQFCFKPSDAGEYELTA